MMSVILSHRRRKEYSTLSPIDMRPRTDGKNNRLLSARARLLIRTTTVEILMPGLENVTLHVRDLKGLVDT